MTAQQEAFIADKKGFYRTTRPVSPDELIGQAERILSNQLRGETLSDPKTTMSWLTTRLGRREHEVFAVIWLDTRNRIITLEELFRGTIDGASVYPREVAKSALLNNAAAAIIAHNHPSGVADPSRADMQITQRIQDALSLMDVRLLDHVIVAGADTYSFAEHGRL